MRLAFDQLDAADGRIGNGARLFSRIAWVLPGMDALTGLRHRIGALEIDAAQSTAAFGKLIAGLIAVVFEAADGATDPEISRLLVALFNFMQGKEFAGQERACGAAAFASGRNDGARQQQWLHLIASQEHCFELFADFAAPGVAEVWGSVQAAAATGRAGAASTHRLRGAGRRGARQRAEPGLVRLLHPPHRRHAGGRGAADADLRQLCLRKTTQARSELQAHEVLLASLQGESGATADFFLDTPATPEAPAGRRPTAGNSSARSSTWCRSSRAGCRPWATSSTPCAPPSTSASWSSAPRAC